MRNIFFSILLLFLFSFIPITIYSDNNMYDENIFRKDIKLFFNNISDEDIKTLIESGMVDNFPESLEDFKFIPDISSKKEISDTIKKLKFNIASECLFFIPFKKENQNSRKNALIDAFTIATNIEKLKGVKYYSVSSKGEKVLFEKSEIISGKVLYPITEIPASHLITAKIEDSTFGNNKYKIEYKSSSESIMMKMSNIDRLFFAFFPVVGKESLLFNIVIIPGEEGFFLYINGISKTVDTESINKRITQSVYNRLVALYNWFKENYNTLQ